MSDVASPYRFSRRSRDILVALSDALIEEPSDIVIPDKHEQMLSRCEILLFEMHPFFRLGFVLSLWLFDLFALFWNLELTRFINMTVERRRDFVVFWERTRNPFMREFFKALRTLIMLTYFSHTDIWKYIGYDPRAHVQDRIALRKNILKKTVHAGPSDTTGGMA